MIELKTWYVLSQPGYVRPHSWLYALRIVEDPWGIGTYRWDLHDTKPERPWRGEYEQINERLHRITVKRPLGDTVEYELRPLDEEWISHDAECFCCLPLMTLAGERIPLEPCLERVLGWLDYTHGKRIIWREKQIARMESRRMYLTEAMVEAFILECSRYDFRRPTRAVLFAEPEGVMLDPPWVVSYSFKETASENRMYVRISNRFTNDQEFTIGQKGDVER